MKRIDLTGQRFGRLVVRSVASAERGIVKWNCECDCGTTQVVQSTHLRSGHTRSCGCWRNEQTTARNRAGAKHGMHLSPEYGIWRSMVKRCHSPTAHAYDRYGGRGITVCPEWRTSFEAFYEHVGARPSPAHSIEREDNSRGYEPGNVKWATDSEQNNNRRNNLTATIGGEVLTAAQIAQRYGLTHRTVSYRIHAGKTEAEIIAPVRPR